jgi:DNA-binding NtrC family response regulator
MECGGQRILLVDDDPSLLKMMSIYLGRVGFAVTVSSRTDEAWKAFEASPGDFAVAVLDGSMPGLRMEELATRMLHTNPRMCVIAASGYPLDMTAVESVAQGRAMFLQKPFSTAMLTAAVRRMIAAQEKEL